MSEFHLQELRNGIERSHWLITSELEGNDNNISGFWIIERPARSHKLHIEFNGLDELGVIPMSKSYGCSIREYPEISVYFSRKGKSWPDELKTFLDKLKELDK